MRQSQQTLPITSSQMPLQLAMFHQKQSIITTMIHSRLKTCPTMEQTSLKLKDYVRKKPPSQIVMPSYNNGIVSSTLDKNKNNDSLLMLLRSLWVNSSLRLSLSIIWSTVTLRKSKNSRIQQYLQKTYLLSSKWGNLLINSCQKLN